MNNLFGLQIMFLAFQAILQTLIALGTFYIVLYLLLAKPVLLEKIIGWIVVIVLALFFLGTSANQLMTAKGDVEVPLFFSGFAIVVSATIAISMRKNYKKILDR